MLREYPDPTILRGRYPKRNTRVPVNKFNQIRSSSRGPHRTPKDDAGGSGQIVPEYHIAPTGTEPPFCSCRVSPLSRPQPFFRQGDNVSSFVLLSLSLVSRVLSCVCVCNLEFNPFFDNIICKSDAGNLRVAF
jgi:hypothetical protein